MDRKAPAEGSSSQNDNPFVECLQEGPAAGITKVVLSTGSFFFARSSYIGKLGLKKHSPVDIDMQAALEIETVSISAENKALDLLKTRNHSRSELQRKLAVRGFPDAAVIIALENLESGGILDDLRFAEEFARYRFTRRLNGPILIKKLLLDRGIDRTTADAAVSEAVSVDEIMEILQAATVKLLKRRPGSLHAFMNSLLRRGFDMQSINGYLQQNRTNLPF